MEQNSGCQDWGWGECEDVGQRVQTSSYNINEFWGSNVQHGNNTVLCT